MTVTGTGWSRPTAADAASEARTVSRRIAASRSRFHGRAAPPPLRVTLGTGQPKLRSMWSARSSSTSIRTALPAMDGSTPYSWIERTRSPGSVRTIARVFSLRSTRARVVTISVTYSPAGATRCPSGSRTGPSPSGRSAWGRALSPYRRHRRRKDAFVTPAMGASSTGVGTSMGPMRSGGSTAAGTSVVMGA